MVIDHLQDCIDPGIHFNDGEIHFLFFRLLQGWVLELDVKANVLRQGLEGLFQGCKRALNTMAPAVALEPMLPKCPAVSNPLGSIALTAVGLVERH